MKFTDRQKFLIENLDRITCRRKASGMRGFFLAGDECTSTINSLIVKGAIARTRDGTELRLSTQPRA